MYAIFQIGSKQYRISKGQVIRLEKLNIAAGEIIEFTKVVMVVNNEEVRIGAPFIERGIVKAEIMAHGHDTKIKIIKFHRRKHYRKLQGHRQWFTDVRIISINI